jgi:hypothetical protein
MVTNLPELPEAPNALPVIAGSFRKLGRICPTTPASFWKLGRDCSRTSESFWKLGSIAG